VTPDAVLPEHMRVEPEMVAQDMARDILDHARAQAGIDHARERHLQRRIADDALDPGPE
jgi:hypothetical protein